MSYQMVEAVLKHSRSRGGARLLLLCIAHHAPASGQRIQIALSTLEAETGIGRREIQRFCTLLCELEELDKQSGGGRLSSTYGVLLPRPGLSALGPSTIEPSAPCVEPIGGPEPTGGPEPMGGSGPSGGSELSAEEPTGGSGTLGHRPTTGAGSHGCHPTGGSLSGGLIPTPAVGPAPPTQITKNVNVVATHKLDEDTAAELVRALEREQVARSVALKLVQKYPERIRCQVQYLDERQPNNRAAVLVASVQENWAPPVAFQKRQLAAENADQERQSARQAATEQLQAKRLRQEAASQAEREAREVDAVYQSLNESKRAEIDEEALKRLGPFARRGQAQAGLEAIRREVIREQMK